MVFISMFRLSGLLPKLLLMSLLPVSFLATAEEKKLLIIDSQAGEPYEEARNSMLQELSSQGFITGKNLIVTQHNSQNKTGLTKRWLRLETPNQYNVIFVNGTIATSAAMKWGYGGQEKFVFASVTDPVGIGVVNELGKPPFGNFTGVPYGVPIADRLRFLQQALPDAKTIGLIHTDMPQSAIYVDRLKVTLRQPEFANLKVIFHKIPFINTDKGHIRMAQLTSAAAATLHAKVDLFMTPSDQFGITKAFSAAIKSASSKPLMGLSKDEVKDWGAHFALYPRQDLAGKKAGKIIAGLLNGEAFEEQIPDYALGEYAINIQSAKNSGITFPDHILQDKNIVIFKED